MRTLLFLILVFPLSLQAQDILGDLQKINQELGQNAVDDYLDKPSEEGISGDFFGSLMPAKDPSSGEVCEETQEPKKTHFEVILIAQGTSETTQMEVLPQQGQYFSTNNLKILMENVPQSESSKGVSESSIRQRAQDVWKSGMFSTPSEDYDPFSKLGQELFIESLVHAAAGSDLNEFDLTNSLAGAISQTYQTDEAKYNVLSALSSRLYRNYNDSRNPGYNNKINNPYGAPIPEGDMTMNELMKGAANFNVFDGGVCNDISETVAMIGEKLFPTKDVLVVNSGTHFGVVVADGEGNRIIDGGTQIKLQNQLLLDPTMSPTNLRINKVENGALKEIAVVDTQMGQLTEAAFQTGKNLLKTDADINSLIAELKYGKFSVVAGGAKFTDSNVMIVVAKYETSGDKWKSYIGTGMTSQNYTGLDLPNKYQVHFKAGAERRMFRYVNQQTSINFSTGTRLSGMYALNQEENPNGIARVDLSGSLDFYNRLDMNFTPKDPKGFRVNSSLEVEHTLGPNNWGNTTGAMSYMEPSDTGRILKNLSFHLNQVNANVTAEKPLNDQLTSVTSVNYQGSNIGQSVSVLSGIDIKVPRGAQLLVFTSYSNSEIGGYKSQNSLLANPSGFHMGANYTNPNGVQFGAAVRDVAGKPSFEATLKVPLGKKKK